MLQLLTLFFALASAIQAQEQPQPPVASIKAKKIYTELEVTGIYEFGMYEYDVGFIFTSLQTAQDLYESAESVDTFFQVAVSQIFTVPSRLAVARCRPSGLQAAHPVSAVWPISVCMHFPVSGFQTLTVPSAEQVAICRLSGLQATDHST